MTVEQEVDALTTAVDTLKSTVVSKKATLDASVSDAQAATALATTAKTAALSARDQASASKDAAYAYAQSAGSAVAYQDLTALAASKAVTAVDVFVYDTSKDSDGGAWRKRTQHTSWYNETLNTATRGSRREFPAVAVIVAEARKVTIYDGDDPSLPMWLVADEIGQKTSAPYGITALGGHANNIGQVYALNGQVCICGAGGYTSQVLLRWDFLADRFGNQSSNSLYSGWTAGTIAQRNSIQLFAQSLPVIVSNAYVNDVAMTVLPDAPTDPDTGLPVPTIAVATNGGVSVIRDDGTVVDSASTFGFGSLVFDEYGLWYNRNIAAHILFVASYSDIEAGDGFGGAVAETVGGSFSFDLLTRGTKIVAENKLFAFGGASATGSAVAGLMLHQPNYTDQSKGMSALLTSTYNTGWMNGDIKGAFLSSTDATSLVGSGELVTNGTFDTDTSGWTLSTSSGGTVSHDASGKLAVERTSGITSGVQSITLPAGLWLFSGSAEHVSGSGFAQLSLRSGEAVASPILAESSGSAGLSADFLGVLSLSAPTTVYVHCWVGLANSKFLFDNISVKLADADRSVNNKGLIVNGTITRSPVATGAELVAYDCSFGYLYRDFAAEFSGSDTFCLMGWHYGDPDKSGNFFTWYETVGGGTSVAYLNAYIDATTGAYRLVWQSRASLLPNTTPSISGRWALVALVFSGNTVSYYLDGVLVSTASSVPPVDLHELRINPKGGNKKALWRISATAPTADQIAKIYEDEKVLFQENAACTLYGTSDAVTALAHDPDTGLLHVGTSQGRSTFKGLRRVANTTQAVGTAISAVNGMVVEE